MPLPAATRLGSYEILGPLGSGGMGEVYRARDSRLGRDVAVKILPPQFASDPLLRERFEREARTLAALSHPHICAVFDVGHQDGIDFLVMEHLEGETLAERLSKGPLPVDQALRSAIQIADALDKAHRKGIIHRDLKPGNVMLLKGGIKLLDFGLAKTAESSASALGASMLPTTPPSLTAHGTILGTFQYMSPEQLEGRDADPRTDIFAFGAVLYEMLTGRKAFEGKSQASLISAIMTSEPPAVSALVPLAPPALDQIVRTCLAKDPDERWQTAADIERQLRWIADGRSQATTELGAPAVVVNRTSRKTIVSGAIGLVAGATIAAAATWLLTRPAAPTVQRLSMVDAAHSLALGWSPGLSIAVSPDGTRVAYIAQQSDAPVVAAAPGTNRRLYVRSLDTVTSVELAGTESAAQPFFSPDGQWLAFFTTSGELKKISLAGGRPVTLASKINGSTWTFGTWADNGTIVFGGGSQQGLLRVSADVGGGEPVPVTTLDTARGEWSHSRPWFLDGARSLVFQVTYAQLKDPRIEALRLDTRERTVVLENASAPRFLESGHLLFKQNDAILVAPFDVSKLALAGPAVPLVDDISRTRGTTEGSELGVSRSGALVYVPAGEVTAVLGIVGRDGAIQTLGLAPNRFNFPRASRDGRYLAVDVFRPGQDSEVHVHDISRGSTTKLAVEGSTTSAAWRPTKDPNQSPELSVTSRRSKGSGIYLKTLGGPETLLVPTPANATVRNACWSPDGMRMAYTLQNGDEHDIWVLTMGDKPSASAWLATAAREYGPRFSPDGRSIAYVSNESGRYEVYVRGYANGSSQSVSVDGGQSPVWSADGRELFFTGPHDGVAYVMTVGVTRAGNELTFSAPKPLFPMRVTDKKGVTGLYSAGNNVGGGFDVLPDGRFVMIRGRDPLDSHEIVVVQHFFEEVKRLAPLR